MSNTYTTNKYFALSHLARWRSVLAAGTHHGSRIYQACVSVVMVLLLVTPNSGNAAQLSLANAPLFLDTTVQSNIFYMLDDSGSMDWEVMTTDSANGGRFTGTQPDGTSPGGSGSVKHRDSDDDGSAECGFGDGTFTGYLYIVEFDNNTYSDSSDDCNTADDEAWRIRNSDFNPLYFDPTKQYTPWAGDDIGGNPYADVSITNAPNDPYNPTEYIDLTQHNSNSVSGPARTTSDRDSDGQPDGFRYYTWTDDGDGVFEDGEETEVLIKNASATIQQNFANWFSYHRSREYVLKYVVSHLIEDSQVRVGFSTINNNDSVGTQIEDVDDLTSPIDVTAAANKATLLANLAQIRSANGTPLREGLEDVGRYFEGVSQTALFGGAPTNSGTMTALTPILSVANGGACQQNFTVLMTDGFYNGSDPSLAGDDNTDADGDSPNSAGNTTFDGGAYADTDSDTLADVAMHYYERDLWSTLADDVPVTAGVDDADHQHMVTYTVAFGVSGTLAGPPPNKTDPFSWPDPTVGNAEKIDDLAHAAYNGRGEFLSAQDPTTLDQALSDAISSISDRTGSASAVAVNSRSLNTNTKLYQARFTSGEWSGDLRAISVNTDGTVGSQLWSSKTQLIAQNWDTGRAIITRNATKGIPFRWVTSGTDALTASQQTTLNTDPITSTADAEGQARLNYLRGDSTDEGGGNNYRVRNGGFKFGDAVNSSPVFVGPPPFLPDFEAVAHSSFRTTHVNRREMVYIGANDGMLHGFDATTGDEKIAYVPTMSTHFSNLNLLTDPSYVHRYYVDGSPTVADAFGLFSNGCSSTACWRTVLVGSMGGGGKGVFALDVTDPDGADVSNLVFTEANANNISLWEFTDTTTPDDMGYTYGQATITRVKTGASTTAWAAIFANGYNSVNERAILYVVNIATGAQIAKIDLSSSNGTGNGLSTPAVIDDDGDNISDYVYAGDLLGNMWKIDLTNNNTSQWGSYFKQGSNPKPLFKAEDGSNNPQPITTRPEVSDHPDGEAGFMVYFGTGKYIENGDKIPSASPIQTFYGIWDENAGGSTNSPKVDRDRLRAQTISVVTGVTINGASVRTVTDDRLGNAGTTGNTQGWGDTGSACGSASGNCMGWRVDLLTNQPTPTPTWPNSLGEMAVSNPVLVGGDPKRIIFTTLIPETAGSCNFGGTSWLMELNPIHGGQLNFDVFGCNCTGDTTFIGINPDMGIMPEPVILRDPENSTDLKIVTGSTGAVNTLKNFVNTPPGGRQSWRQLR